MAVRSALLGGTDWADGEKPKGVDMRDTFDAIVNLARTTTAFWLNSNLYDVYDDFDSYSTGAFTTNANWEVTLVSSGSGAGASCSIVETQTAGGTGKELQLRVASGDGSNNGTGTTTVKALDLDTNKHTFIRVHTFNSFSATTSPTCTLAVRLKSSDSFITVYSSRSTSSANTTSMFFIVALGDDKYDLYYGGKKIISDTSSPDYEIEFRASSGTGGNEFNTRTIEVHFDDVRQSKGAVL